MRRGFVAFIALSLIGAGLTGCGLFRFEQREPWRAQAEEACLAQRLVQPSAYMALSSRIDGPGVCGVDHPFKIAAFTNGSVGLKSKVTLACPIIPRIDTWLDEIVKPAAMLYFGVPVTDIGAGSYSCRPRNNRRGAKLSEHGFGNALDVMSFTLADGRQVSVVKGWRGAPAEQEFLREAFVGACRYFTTVLGPGSDANHHDHFHLDLARHNPRGDRRVCKPILKFEPRIDPTRTRMVSPSQPMLPAREDPDEPPGSPIRAPMPSAAQPHLQPRSAPYAAGLRADESRPQTYPAPRPYPPAQTYAPPLALRPSASEPLSLSQGGIY